MNTGKSTIIVGLLLCFVTALAAPQGAMALTDACTPIGNRADVSYKVGGFDQAVASSNTNTIVVGNKVNLTVATINASGVSVVSGQNDKFLSFTIRNDGNAIQKYGLGYLLKSGSTNSVFSSPTTVNSNMAPTGAATGDVAGNPQTVTGNVASGATTTVTIKATMPSGLTTDSNAVYALIATALKTDGTTTETNSATGVIDSAYGSCTADVVVGDIAGTDDSAADAKHSARSAFSYSASGSSLTVSKTSTVYWDPINLTVLPKAIPGAIMEYIVAITNPGGAGTATAITINDTLDAKLTPLSGAAWTSKTGGVTGCSGEAQVKIGAAPAYVCLTTGIGSSGWVGQKLTAVIDSLASGTTATILYQATIQ